MHGESTYAQSTESALPTTSRLPTWPRALADEESETSQPGIYEYRYLKSYPAKLIINCFSSNTQGVLLGVSLNAVISLDVRDEF